jgi:pilus assembly protein CpaD
MMFPHTRATRRRSPRTLAVNLLAAAGLAVVLAGCQHTQEVAEAPLPPNDYRLRHPIAIREGVRTVELFIGSARGTLTPAQRADVADFALSWKREATGGVIIDLPAGTPNQRAARDATPEIRSMLVAAGVPGGSISVQSHRVADPTRLATVRLNYPKMRAAAGPCGLWPEDLGPAYYNRGYIENRQYWNFGCASQHNLAAMVENPADLVQPRGETPVYSMRRTTVMEKYRLGTSPATVYPNAGDGKISDVGK